MKIYSAKSSSNIVTQTKEIILNQLDEIDEHKINFVISNSADGYYVRFSSRHMFPEFSIKITKPKDSNYPVISTKYWNANFNVYSTDAEEALRYINSINNLNQFMQRVYQISWDEIFNSLNSYSYDLTQRSKETRAKNEQKILDQLSRLVGKDVFIMLPVRSTTFKAFKINLIDGRNITATQYFTQYDWNLHQWSKTLGSQVRDIDVSDILYRKQYDVYTEDELREMWGIA